MIKKRTVRVVCYLLAALLLVGLVTGVAFWTASVNPDAKEPGLYVDGERVEDPGVMLTIGDHEVSFADYRHYFLVMKTALEAYYGTVNWEYDPDGDLALLMQDRAEEELLDMYAWLEIAKDEGITLDEEDLAAIDADIAEKKETYGDGFEGYLAGRYYEDEAAYRRITEEDKLYQKVQEWYLNKMEEEHADEAEGTDGLITARHILFGKDEYGSMEEAKTAAEQYYQEIIDSDDPEAKFVEIQAEYDADAAGQPEEGYTFAEGDMVEPFYEAAKALEVGGMSAPVETDFGYHIIWRLPLNAEGAEAELQQQVSTIAQNYANEALQAKMETLTVTKGPYYKLITTTNIV